MKLPRICFVSMHNCIRASKMAHVLYRKGYELTNITEVDKFPEYYVNTMTYKKPLKLQEAIRRMEPYVDIWHVHNEPNNFVIEIKKISKKPIILDLHDEYYWRFTERVTPDGEKVRWYTEDIAIEMSDALNVQSIECKEELETRTNKKIAITPTMNSIEWFDYGDVNFKGGICLEGGIATTNDKWELWRDYKKLTAALVKNHKFYIYSPTFMNRQSLESEYQQLGAITNNMHHFDMISTMKQHSWSLMGNWPVKAPVWDYVHPNKLWDSMAAGIPVVSFGCKAIERIIDKYNIGITVKDPNELNDRWEENFEKRMNVALIRENFALENNIQELIDLYKELS